MKKIELSINSQFFDCTIILFLTNVFSIPSRYFFIDFFTFRYNPYQFSLKLFILCMILFFSAACSFAVQKLMSAKNDMLTFCVIFLLTDPLFKCSLLNLKHFVLLILTLLLCIYVANGKYFKLKTLYVMAFISFAVIINIESAFSHVPIVVLMYGFCWLSQEEKLVNKTHKYKKYQEMKNKKTILEYGFILRIVPLIIIVLFFLSIIINKKITNAIQIPDLAIHPYGDSSIFFYNGRFWVAAVPGFIVLVVFIRKYILVNYEGEKISFVFKKTRFLMVFVLVFVLVIIGVFVFGYSSSVTILNLINTATIVSICINYPHESSKATNALSAFYLKYKFVLYTIYGVWICFTQHLFKGVQYSLIDEIASLAGSKL